MILISLSGLLLVGLNFFAEAQVLRLDSDPKCPKPYELYRGGLGSKVQFRELYRTCYDRINVATKYTQHTIKKSAKLKGWCRPNWRTSKLLSAQEKSSMQMKHIRSLTSTSFPDYFRGHLAPCGDFPTAEERYATMEIINSLPQLSEVNNGGWKAMENFLQGKGRDRDVNVVTGGLGVLQYNGRPVYLSGTSGNPIPEFIYKVALVKGATQDELYAFIAYNYVGGVDPRRLAAYCDEIDCQQTFKLIVCCDQRKFIQKNLPAFKSFFGI